MVLLVCDLEGIVRMGRSISTSDAPAEGVWEQLDRDVPGKSWFTILRLYGPLEACFDQTWRPDDIEPIAT